MSYITFFYIPTLPQLLVLVAPPTIVGIEDTATQLDIVLPLSVDPEGSSTVYTVTVSDKIDLLSASGMGVSGSGTTKLTITGTLGQVDADLATATDTGATPGTDEIAVSANDGSSMGLGDLIPFTVIAPPVITGATVIPDLWNVPSGSDVTVFSDVNSTGGLFVAVTFHDLALVTPADVVAGYPDVSYGQNPFGGASTDVPSALALPLQVSDIVASDTWLSASYSIFNPQNVPLVFAYDMFLTADPATPSSTGPASLGGGLELMIWTDAQDGLSPSSGMPGPLATLSLPTWIDDQLTSANWNVSVGPGGAGTEDVTFALANPIASGSVWLDLSTILTDLGSATIADADGIDASALSSLYLDDIQLGTEFGPGASGSAGFSWSLSQFSIGNSPLDIAAPSAAQVAIGTASPVSGVSLAESAAAPGETFTVQVTDGLFNLSATGTGVTGAGTPSLTIAGSLGQVNSDLATLSSTAETLEGSYDTITIEASDSLGDVAQPQQISESIASTALPDPRSSYLVNMQDGTTLVIYAYSVFLLDGQVTEGLDDPSHPVYVTSPEVSFDGTTMLTTFEPYGASYGKLGADLWMTGLQGLTGASPGPALPLPSVTNDDGNVELLAQMSQTAVGDSGAPPSEPPPMSTVSTEAMALIGAHAPS